MKLLSQWGHTCYDAVVCSLYFIYMLRSYRLNVVHDACNYHYFYN